MSLAPVKHPGTRCHVGALLIIAGVAGCAMHTPAWYPTPIRKPSANDSVAVGTPVKVFMLDSSTIMYRAGVLVVRDTVRSASIGTGYRYWSTRPDSVLVGRISMDSVSALETSRSHDNGAQMGIGRQFAIFLAIPAFVFWIAEEAKLFGW